MPMGFHEVQQDVVAIAQAEHQSFIKLLEQRGESLNDHGPWSGTCETSMAQVLAQGSRTQGAVVRRMVFRALAARDK